MKTKKTLALMAQLHFYHTQLTKRCMSWLSTDKMEADCKKKTPV